MHAHTDTHKRVDTRRHTHTQHIKKKTLKLKKKKIMIRDNFFTLGMSFKIRDKKMVGEDDS